MSHSTAFFAVLSQPIELDHVSYHAEGVTGGPAAAAAAAAAATPTLDWAVRCRDAEPRHGFRHQPARFLPHAVRHDEPRQRLEFGYGRLP